MLTDQHLLAEYRELPRIFPLAAAAFARAAVTGDEITAPSSYTLGKGHVRFFYDKTGWLAERQASLISELIDRGYDPKHRTTPEPLSTTLAAWRPTDADHAVNLDRLRERLAQRPGWYTHRRKPVDAGWYDRTGLGYRLDQRGIKTFLFLGQIPLAGVVWNKADMNDGVGIGERWARIEREGGLCPIQFQPVHPGADLVAMGERIKALSASELGAR
jgi:hypothetical protein